MSIDLEKILANLKELNPKKKPPVHLWHPQNEGVIDITIDEKMHWFHEGVMFQRDALMRLFASILRFENGNYYLVTPVEKLKIHVVDVPFEVVSCISSESDSEVLLVITNVEDVVALDKNTVWELRDYHGEMIPYIEIRHGLFARVSRSEFYAMIDNAKVYTENTISQMVLCSGGREFLLGSYQEQE